jgi:hypothetical protein
MPRYAITEKAGRFVAGQTNTGVGTVLTLTEKQAAHELRLGSLQLCDVPAARERARKGKRVSGGKAAVTPAAGEDAGQAAREAVGPGGGDNDGGDRGDGGGA